VSGKKSRPGRRLLQAHRGDQHHGVAHGDEHRAVGLTREFARLNGYGVITILKTFFDSAHVDALGQQGNLNFGGTGVLRAALEFTDDARLFFASEWH
jgi:hypothetical protein